MTAETNLTTDGNGTSGNKKGDLTPLSKNGGESILKPYRIERRECCGAD